MIITKENIRRLNYFLDAHRNGATAKELAQQFELPGTSSRAVVANVLFFLRHLGFDAPYHGRGFHPAIDSAELAEFRAWKASRANGEARP